MDGLTDGHMRSTHRIRPRSRPKKHVIGPTSTKRPKLTWKITQKTKPKETHKKKSKPNMRNCKNCSRVCAYHCAQLSYTTQHRAVLIIFPLIRQAPELRCCLLEWKGISDWKMSHFNTHGLLGNKSTPKPTKAASNTLNRKRRIQYIWLKNKMQASPPMPPTAVLDETCELSLLLPIHSITWKHNVQKSGST